MIRFIADLLREWFGCQIFMIVDTDCPRQVGKSINKRLTCEHLDLDAVAVRKAADQGNALAQFNLGSMYAKGHGVPQDYVFAYVWFDLAVPQFPASKI
jgi:hypothetical protein